MDIQSNQVSYLKILNKYNHNEVYICYDGEEAKPGLGEIIISVKDDHYHVYTSERGAKHNVHNFQDEEMVLCYIACMLNDGKGFYNEIMSYLNDKENQTLMTDFYELTMAQTYLSPFEERGRASPHSLGFRQGRVVRECRGPK